ncbi:hypothetical protein [Methanocella conradii]|nr:hypothetical protein [Methanocella conradii]
MNNKLAILAATGIILSIVVPLGASATTVQWSGIDESQVNSNFVASWLQTIPSTAIAQVKQGQDNLAWYNKLFNYRNNSIKGQVSWAFTDGTGGDYVRSWNAIPLNSYWDPTPTTWTVTSGLGRWELGVNHRYTTNYDTDPGVNTGTHGQYYNVTR